MVLPQTPFSISLQPPFGYGRLMAHRKLMSKVHQPAHSHEAAKPRKNAYREWADDDGPELRMLDQSQVPDGRSTSSFCAVQEE